MRKKSTEDSIEQSQIQPSTQRPIKKSKTVKRKLRPSLFFFVQRRMRFLMLGRSVGLEKQFPKKNHKKSRNRRPWYPRITLKVNIHITRLTKCTIYCKKHSCFCSFFFSTPLLCSFFRLKELFYVKNGLTTSYLFCFENTKNLGCVETKILQDKVIS